MCGLYAGYLLLPPSPHAFPIYPHTSRRALLVELYLLNANGTAVNPAQMLPGVALWVEQVSAGLCEAREGRSGGGRAVHSE